LALKEVGAVVDADVWAGRRTVPLPHFVVQALKEHRTRYGEGPAGEVFINNAGGPVWRTVFRTRVWRPALVRAGLLGKVVQEGRERYKATWRNLVGLEHSRTFDSEREAIAETARHAAGGLRFHDLRHSYATWLVSDGVPVNDVQRIMGHEQATTTLNLYTHSSGGVSERVRKTFDAFSLPQPTEPLLDDHVTPRKLRLTCENAGGPDGVLVQDIGNPCLKT
jgi:integrase